MNFYAQLNGSGVCYAVTQTDDPVVQVNMIPIPAYDLSYLGKTYSEGAWS